MSQAVSSTPPVARLAAPPKASEGERFDVIVIGGGSAGCVVAGRVASDSRSTVLLLEAGHDDTDPLIHIPAGFAKILQHDLHVWQNETVEQEQLDGAVRRFRSGKVIGGGSAVNAMCYVRGQPQDFDAWQAAVGSTGKWSFADILPHFIKQEHNDRFRDDWHGSGGPLKITQPRTINELNLGCMRAFQEFGLPYNPDYNGKTQIGVSPVQSNISDSRRVSAADAFLRPAQSTGRIETRVRCLVTRILIEAGRAVGVEYLQNGKKHVAYASEVVLSAGAVHSPKLLMLSGIGPAEQLQALGIPVLVDSPEVGSNLQDHPIVPIAAHCKLDLGYQKSAQGIGAATAAVRYAVLKDGPAAGNAVETVSYFDPDDLNADPTIQCYHMPVITKDGLSPSGTQAGMTFETVVLRPKSRGSIKLRDADPESMPLIDPNYFADPSDMATVIKAIRLLRKVMQMPSLKNLMEPELVPGLARQTDAELAEWVKTVATTMWHPTGTCRMGSDERAVVDAQLRVNGVKGLRVIDASIMPNITSGNTNAPTMALADRGADFLLAELAMAN